MLTILDKYLGRGEFSITVPPFDGALMPNEELEKAENRLALEGADCLAFMDGTPVVSSGGRILTADAAGREVAKFDAPVTCMTGLPRGELAAGLADGRIILITGKGQEEIIGPDKARACLTAMAADAGGRLFVTHGSSTNPCADWKKDLMEKNKSGSVWRVNTATGGQTRLCAGLAFPYGIMVDTQGLILSESWRSRLVRIDPERGGPPREVLTQLPAYPSRIAPARGGGAWLTLFAPRSQLVEFVLRETRYRTLMVRTIDPAFWVAPSLRSNRSFYEPLQAGGVKQLGIMKPWAPARSYGLVIRLDENFQPAASLHSRADGSCHGITGCLEQEGELLLAVKGDGMVASYSLSN